MTKPHWMCLSHAMEFSGIEQYSKHLIEHHSVMRELSDAHGILYVDERCYHVPLGHVWASTVLGALTGPLYYEGKPVKEGHSFVITHGHTIRLTSAPEKKAKAKRKPAARPAPKPKPETPVKMTPEAAIEALQLLAARWPKDKLWLFSWSGSLCVMKGPKTIAMQRDDDAMRDGVITTIDIPNDGGDP